MSSPTWTRDALSSEFVSYEGQCFRVVEPQHVYSTMKVVDTATEQKILEEVIGETKPPIAPDYRECADFLVYTPSRYAPVDKGSRFRRAGQELCVFYGSETVETAMAEMAFYRALFYSESPETKLPDNAAYYTSFAVDVCTNKALDLMQEPFVQYRDIWTAAVDYGPCQNFADTARDADAGLIRFQSVRCPASGENIAILQSSSFASQKSYLHQTWGMRITRKSIVAIREFPRLTLDFNVALFATDPRISDWYGGESK